MQSRAIQVFLCSNYNATTSLTPSGQLPGLHPDMRECLHNERVVHKRRGTDDKEALQKTPQINNCRKHQTSSTRKENAEQRSRNGKRRDKGDTTKEERSAHPICSISLNISLGTERYSKTDYSKLDEGIQKDAVKVNCF